jgi:hypothetical protein
MSLKLYTRFKQGVQQFSVTAICRRKKIKGYGISGDRQLGYSEELSDRSGAPTFASIRTRGDRRMASMKS